MNEFKNITILGTGAYGTALANVLTDNNHNVIMYGIDESEINDINNNHINSKFFGNLKINKMIKATSNFNKAIEFAEYIVFSVPIVAIKNVISKINKYLKRPVVFINVIKGLDPETNNILSYTLRKNINSKIVKALGGLYGPSIAQEVLLKKPTCIMAVSDNIEIANDIRNLFNNNYFIAFVNDDIIGVEYIAALKNVIAIASGIFSELYNSDNTRALIITIGINEIKKIALVKGASINTFLSYPSLGDLLLTSTSNKSRNYSLGVEIAKKDNAKIVLDLNNNTVEGVLTCKIIYEISKKEKIRLPLFEALYFILYENKKPSYFIKNIFDEVFV